LRLVMAIEIGGAATGDKERCGVEFVQGTVVFSLTTSVI
jgi:hypothetical protein